MFSHIISHIIEEASELPPAVSINILTEDVIKIITEDSQDLLTEGV